MSLLENMAKHVVVIKDSILDDVLHFLDSCQCKLSRTLSLLASIQVRLRRVVYGREVQTTLEHPVGPQVNSARFTVTYEARVIKSLLLQIMRT